MRLVVRVLLLVMVSSALTVAVGVSPASAITCVYDSTSVAKEKRCKNWNAYRSGVAVTGTYSSYIYDCRTKCDNISQTLTLRDNRKDGKCARLRARKTKSVLNFNVVQAKVCGYGKSRKVQLSWRGANMAKGNLSLRACAGKRDCRQIWFQKIS